MKQNSHKTLKHYIHLRLGKGNFFEILKSMFVKAFRAKTAKEFWNYWNPVFGYFMLFYFYKPLTNKVPRAIRVIATFTVSGFFLHDLLLWWPFCWMIAYKTHFPLGTVWFLFLAIIMLILEKKGFSTERYSPEIRVLTNFIYISIALGLTLLVEGGIKLLIFYC
ncbi:MAG: MBOAT family O-acyltransferase [Candidatus Tenebribacter burtonii]|jgi:hypothetical protein|nr:MBOAT family O-acyltransferase [Candidatus Tenebribacter burtonii]